MKYILNIKTAYKYKIKVHFTCITLDSWCLEIIQICDAGTKSHPQELYTFKSLYHGNQSQFWLRII